MIEPERLDYPLNASSLVWDVGAYGLEFADAILDRFKCEVVGFEPIPQFYSNAPRMWVVPIGLSDRDEEIEIPLAGDRTTTYPTEAAMHVEYRPGKMQKIWLRDVVGFMDEHNVQNVDLAKINIEGGEYPLLRRLIDSGYVSRFRHLQVQFHQFIPDFGEKYLALKKDLLRTHDLSWRWPWKWESWARR